MTDSFHHTTYGARAAGMPRDLDGYVHTTAAAWLAAPMDSAGGPMTAGQAEELAEQARAAVRAAEASLALWRDGKLV